jgi:hypothetical protein
MYCEDCFACVGLKHRKYCILNRQYSAEDYYRLVEVMIEKMHEQEEWGEFFHPGASPLGYNDSLAAEYFPLSREEAMARRFRWTDYRNPEPSIGRTRNGIDLPESIGEISDDILNEAVICASSGLLFRITEAELDFYRSFNLPLPQKHPEERHRERVKQRLPRKLYTRVCSECKVSLLSAYEPNSPLRVLCETCYLKAIY